MHRSTRLSCAVALLCAASTVATYANAEATYGASLGVGHSDNIARSSIEEQEETIGMVGVNFGLTRTGPKLDASVTSQLQYLDYLDDTFDSEVVGSVLGMASLQIIEDRFSWMAQDTFGQTISNQFAPSTPANRENVNVFTTGPDITIPFSSKMDLRLEARYSDVHYEDSPLGSERVNGLAAIERHISEATRLSLNVFSERVEYEEQSGAAEFDREEAFLRYELGGARTSIAADVGYSWMKRQSNETGGPLARLTISRRLSAASTLSLDAGREYADAGSLFVQLQELAPGSTSTQPVQATADPFESTYGTLRWDFNRNRTGLSLFVTLFDEDYEVQNDFDRERVEYGLAATRNLSRSLSLGMSGSYGENEFTNLDREFAESMLSAYLTWRLGRISYINLEYQYFDRSDDVALNEFSENQVWLRFGINGGGRTTDDPSATAAAY